MSGVEAKMGEPVGRRRAEMKIAPEFPDSIGEFRFRLDKIGVNSYLTRGAAAGTDAGIGEDGLP